jgi:hypothetical protein
VLVERTNTQPPSACHGEIRAFARCRNESLRLPAFLRHYRRLGVDRFFIVDNDSSDDSAEYLAAQSDVQLFRTTNRYGEAESGTAWLNALLAQFGVGCWCVTVDIDELLVYAGSEHTPLRTLTDYLDDTGFDAFACMLLDLYPAGSLKDCRYAPADDLVTASPYFDPGPYDRTPVSLCPGVLIRGGMRERVFYADARSRSLGARAYDSLLDRLAYRVSFLRNTPPLAARRRRTSPCLTKAPLVRWDDKSQYLGMHWVSPKTVAPDTGVLLHVKFLADFHDRAVREAARGEHYEESSEYQRYARKLAAAGDLTLIYDGSMRFEGSDQLVELGLMHETPGWLGARERRIR